MMETFEYYCDIWAQKHDYKNFAAWYRVNTKYTHKIVVQLRILANEYGAYCSQISHENNKV